MIRSLVIIATPLLQTLAFAAPRPRAPVVPGYDCSLWAPFDHGTVGPYPPPGRPGGSGREWLGPHRRWHRRGTSTSGAVAFPADSVAEFDIGKLTFGRARLDILPLFMAQLTISMIAPPQIEGLR